mgnify:CR=1 FL=1
MTTRYYRVTDETILKAIIEYFELLKTTQKKGDEVAKEFGFINASFSRFGMWDASLTGFACSRITYNDRDDKELWIIPKKGYTRPRVKKGSKVYDKYAATCSNLRIIGDDMEKMLGFSHLSFFPTSPGYTFKLDKKIMVFTMPESCEAVNGCVEITNVEYLNL